MCRIVSAMILCPLQGSNLTNIANSSADNKNNSSMDTVVMTPYAVSVVTSSCRRPRNLVRIVDLRRRYNAGRHDTTSSNLGVDYRTNFSVCVPPIFGNFDTVSGLVEFVEVNRVLGAEIFQLYNESVGPRATACLREYVRRGIVDVQPWTLPSDIADVIYYRGQILAINDCLYRMMYRTKYLVIQDLEAGSPCWTVLSIKCARIRTESHHTTFEAVSFRPIYPSSLISRPVAT